MSVLNENQLLGASGAGGDYEIEQSLRFDEGRETRLIRTPTTNGSATTWTWSAWVKRSELSNAAQSTLFAAGVYNGSSTHLHFAGDNTLHFYQYDGGYKFREESTQVFRDTSAWYHIVAVVDTTNGTAADRIKLYVNGVQITSFANVLNPNQNQATFMNLTANKHYIGDFDRSGDGDEFGGYLAEVNFIDGQALTPDSFGETGTYNEWKPIEYAGTYGTNGFYLPFEQDYTVEGFSTVTYEGKGVGQYIGGTGFSPSLTWIKARNQTYDHHLFDVIRGPLNRISSNSTSAESSMTNSLAAFNTDGFTLGDTAQVNLNNGEFVAWNWDMGGTTASNTSGSITSSVRANTTYGQSIVSYTGTGSSTNTDTVGHGLSQKPDLYILKNRTASNSWIVRTDIIDGSSDFLLLDGTAAKANSGVTYATSSVFSLGSSVGDNGSGNNQIAYCFHSVTGYSKFGSYSGNGSSTGPVVTLGFSPAFVMIKGTSASRSWVMYDNTRQPSNPKDLRVLADSSDFEFDGNEYINFTGTGFEIKYSGTLTNASGETYIYMAFADTREYAYWYDQSGNNNDWTSEGGLTESDVMLDSPTNNFATLNPLDKGSITVSEGNTKAAYAAAHETILSTFSVSTGKHYFESYINASTSSGNFSGIGTNAGGILNSHVGSTATSWGYELSGDIWNNNIAVSGNASLATGDILGIAFDADANTITYYKNNTVQPQTHTGIASGTYSPQLSIFHSGSFIVANFGQDSSFAGNKTPQGNQDANGIGDFFYAPPTGFLALCTANLPDVDVIPSEHFNTVLYTGTGSSNAISNLGLTPDFTWIKSRSNTEGHGLVDSVRGATKLLSSNTTDSEATSANYVASLDSDGFTVGTSTLTNGNGYTYVAWNWKAGGTAVSNTNGSITSSVSANPSAGFSIVSYTGVNNSSYGSGTTAVIGHGLSETPDLIIVKSRDNVNDNWVVHHKDSAINTTIFLDKTDALATGRSEFTAVSSSTFSVLGPNFVNRLGENYISYCFHSVESYSKVGSYVGNGNDDGTFIYCGFRPAYVMVKRTDASGNWDVIDTVRNEYNDPDKNLQANTSVAEFTNTRYDILSNGIKMRRGSSGDTNASGGTYIFIAFAESPFKHTNAR